MTQETQQQSGFRIDDLPPYLLGSVQQAVIDARLSGRDIVDLSQVNPMTGPEPRAVDRLVQAALRPHNHRYSASQGITRLRSAIAEHYQERLGVELDTENEVVVTLGTKEGLAHLLLATTSAGDNIIVPTPSYPIHASSVFIAGGGFIGIPISGADEEQTSLLNGASEEFFARLERVFERTWPRPKVMVLSFPHNPTAAVVEQSFFDRLVEFARENSVYLFHDFAYAEVCYDDYRAPSILRSPGAKDVAVEFYSLSKSHGMAGWRIGFCLGNPQLVAALKKVKSYLDFGSFQPLQIAAIEALEHGTAHVDEVVATYQARRDVLVDGLRSIGWDVPSPKAAVFIWAKVPEAFRAAGSIAFAQQLLESADVAVCPGAGFDRIADDYVRFALVEDENRLRKAVKSIKSFFDANS